MKSKITIRQLEVFDAVAMLGSVTDAAERLGMSQSAVSGALTDLQTTIKRTLFARTNGRKLQITDDGKRLRPHIRSLLSEAQEIESGVDSPLHGTLLVGASALIAETVLPELCIRFLNHNPGVRIRVQSATSGELFQSVSRFELETALIEYFPEIEGLELIKWRTDELWLVVAPNHPLATKNKLKIKDLAGVSWCSREPHASVTSRLRVLLHEQAGQMNMSFVASSNSAVRLAAIAGGGAACLSRSLVDADITSGKLVRLDVSDFHFTRNLSLARPKAMRRSRVALEFDRFLLENGDAPNTPVSAAHSSVRPNAPIRE